MSSDSPDIAPVKTINIELDGEVYHFHISSHHDEQFLHRASQKINELAQQIRQEITRVSYPMLFILVCFRLLERMEKQALDDGENVGAEGETAAKDVGDDINHTANNFMGTVESDISNAGNEDNNANDIGNAVNNDADDLSNSAGNIVNSAGNIVNSAGNANNHTANHLGDAENNDTTNQTFLKEKLMQELARLEKILDSEITGRQGESL